MRLVRSGRLAMKTTMKRGIIGGVIKQGACDPDPAYGLMLPDLDDDVTVYEITPAETTMGWIEQRQAWEEARETLGSLDLAIEEAGSQAALAKLLGIHQTSVSQTRTRLKRSPTHKRRTKKEAIADRGNWGHLEKFGE